MHGESTRRLFLGHVARVFKLYLLPVYRSFPSCCVTIPIIMIVLRDSEHDITSSINSTVVSIVVNTVELLILIPLLLAEFFLRTFTHFFSIRRTRRSGLVDSLRILRTHCAFSPPRAP